MSTIVLIIALLLGSVVFIGLGTLIYYLIYRHVINKRIANGDTSKKGMMSPVWMPVILVGLQFIFGNPLLAVILVPFLIFNESTKVEVHKSMEMLCISVEEMQEGHLSVYSIEENEGYIKQQSEGDGIRFTCFSAQEMGNSWQPHYLLYTELSEDFPENAVYAIEGTFYENGEATGGVSWYPTKEEFPNCIISGMPDIEDMDCTYELEITCTVQEEEGGKVLGMLSETFSLSDEKSE
ncbi:MAG: hypothetical protein IKL00_02455 [Oscillospiraceae bacterium]|nr:hypothetical protein [Oscillospiraceae bacterium]